MFALIRFKPRAPHRMNQTLRHSISGNLPITSRQSDVADAIVVRPVTTLAEFQACVKLQEEVRLRMSHMLAVRDLARDLGIGRQLKEAQRDTLAQRGVTRISWTFDPLVAKNAFFNLNRLGARVVRYVNDMYGTSTSPLHHGMPTDRLIVTVDPRAAAPTHTVVDSEPPRQPMLTIALRAGDVAVNTAVPPPSLWIEVPSDVQLVREHAPEAVAAWRHAVRNHFTWALDHGYTVQTLERDVNASRAFYLLSRDAKA